MITIFQPYPTMAPPDLNRRSEYLAHLSSALSAAGKNPRLADAYYRHFTLHSIGGMEIEPADFCYSWYHAVNEEQTRMYMRLVNQKREELRSCQVPPRGNSDQLMEGLEDWLVNDINDLARLDLDVHPFRTDFDFGEFHRHTMVTMGGEVSRHTGPLPEDCPKEFFRRIHQIKSEIVAGNVTSLFFTSGQSYSYMVEKDKEMALVFFNQERV